MKTLTSLHARWVQLRDGSNTATNEEFDWTASELRSKLKSVDWDLSDLEETIQVVETNRTRFKLDDEELKRRKKFVKSIASKLDSIRGDMDSEQTAKKLAADERGTLMTGKGGKVGGLNKYEKIQSSIDADHNDFIQNEQQRQMMIEQTQNEDLTDLGHTVTRIGEIALTIHDEVDEQGVLLDELDEDVTQTQERLKRAQELVDKLLKTTDKFSWCIIFFLFFVIIVLFMLIVQS